MIYCVSGSLGFLFWMRLNLMATFRKRFTLDPSNRLWHWLVLSLVEICEIFFRSFLLFYSSWYFFSLHLCCHFFIYLDSIPFKSQAFKMSVCLYIFLFFFCLVHFIQRVTNVSTFFLFEFLYHAICH